MKYIKKPIPIEAVKVPPKESRMKLEEWDSYFPKWFFEAVERFEITNDEDGLIINTLEGKMHAAYDNSYLIRGIKGEIYPCRADIFEETYEEYKEE